jgi:hypothetical protein
MGIPVPSLTHDRSTQASTGVICRGCGQAFKPARASQQHCRPSCRQKALERRRQMDVDLFTGIWDHVEAEVVAR